MVLNSLMETSGQTGNIVHNPVGKPEKTVLVKQDELQKSEKHQRKQLGEINDVIHCSSNQQQGQPPRNQRMETTSISSTELRSYEKYENIRFSLSFSCYGKEGLK
jgi:hypothetical protein